MKPVGKCTLKAAVQQTIGKKMYCLSLVGRSTYSSAETKCRSRNAKLPMPRNSEENSDLMIALTGMGLIPPHWYSVNQKVVEFTPIILGMVDSARGKPIGNNFSLVLFVFTYELGDWFDNDGSKLTYLNWDKYRPYNAYGAQDFASIYKPDGTWGNFLDDPRIMFSYSSPSFSRYSSVWQDSWKRLGKVVCLQQVNFSGKYFKKRARAYI